MSPAAPPRHHYVTWFDRPPGAVQYRAIRATPTKVKDGDGEREGAVDGDTLPMPWWSLCCVLASISMSIAQSQYLTRSVDGLCSEMGQGRRFERISSAPNMAVGQDDISPSPLTPKIIIRADACLALSSTFSYPKRIKMQDFLVIFPRFSPAVLHSGPRSSAPGLPPTEGLPPNFRSYFISC